MKPQRSSLTGDSYRVQVEDIARFRRDGWVHLPQVVREEELVELEEVVQRFLSGQIPIEGRDFCDMSGDYTKSLDQFSMINVMLPRRYHTAWQGNVYERRAGEIAEQLIGPGLALDYDQLLAKPPGKPDAVFHWHQDLAYWPRTDAPRTATVWLALDDATEENGCIRFVSGSHREPELRPHRPLMGDRDTSHALVADVDETRDRIDCATIQRGDVTVHHERVVHGSGGNQSAGWRRAYVVAFRDQRTVAFEREMGFTHSHNDDPDVLDRIVDEGPRG